MLVVRAAVFLLLWLQLFLFVSSNEYREERVISCSSMKHNFRNVTNTTIMFADCGNGVFNLTSPLNISMQSDLHITGSGGDKASVVECNGLSDVGIILENISNLHLENLQIRNCSNPEFSGSIYIKNCARVTIENITIESSPGAGLVLENNRGEVVIESSTFHDNGLSEYTQESKEREYSSLQKTNRGGGLRVLVGGVVSHSSTLVENCWFYNNSAFSGGGMFVEIKSRALNNTINIKNSHFADNKCLNGGGGGLQIGITVADDKSDTQAMNENTMTVHNCTFSRNNATNGGGTAIFSRLGSFAFSQNKIEFTKCEWTSNTGKLGMAVDVAIAPWETYTRFGLFPTPVFTNCGFYMHNQSTFARRPNSVLSATGFKLKFRGKISFVDNHATAIEALSAELDFERNSDVEFVRNEGIYGGAIKLKGLAVVFIHDNSTFRFEGNRADFGGAIYVESYKHLLVPSESCFIQYKSSSGGEEQQSKKNVHFLFINNTAGYAEDTKGCKYEGNSIADTNCNYRGDSVYATTLLPCLRKCLQALLHRSYLGMTEAFACIGNITFSEPNRRHISTAAHHFTGSDTESQDDQMCQLLINMTDNSLRIYRNEKFNIAKISSLKDILHFIPGKVQKLHVKLVDELCGEIFFHVSVQMLNSKGNIFIDPAYSIITNNSIVLQGSPRASGTIQLSTVGVRNKAITVKVVLDECPPGYVLHESTTCVCSASDPKYQFLGIERCDDKQFRAYIRHGYWMGNLSDIQTLASAICPGGFCTNITHWLWHELSPREGDPLTKALCPAWFCNFTTNQSSEHLLPPNTTGDLSQYICHPNREGDICGDCKANHSAFYRSTSFSCKLDGLCYLGWLFFILTELLPVTILFLVVIFFNISFTSGPLNGVVFFMQVVDTLKLNAENFIRINPQINSFTRVHKFAYRIFVLSVFAIEELSFCLWKNASALDMLAFRYVTIIYSLFLVVATVFLMKMCVFRRRKLVVNLKRSIIHGLSAFVIMSYSECTRVSLMILTRVTVTIGPKSHNNYTYKAFYQGTYPYMGLDHLRYALPAILFLITMVIIPPLLLLSYPLCYKLFALLRIEESKLVQIMCKIFPLEKIKPCFDSIQGAFKDRYRFFSGLYLMYRLCLLLTFTYTKTLTSFYTFTGVQLLSMLLVHSVCRPYKKTWHNILDALLLTNLAVINALTFYNYQLLTSAMNDDIVNKVGGVQAALVLLPLVYLIIYTTYHIVKRIKVACVRKSITHKESDNTDEVIDTLDARNLEDSLVEMNNYILLGPKPKAN